MGCSGSKMVVEDSPKSDTEAETNKFPLSQAFIIPLDSNDPDANNSNIASVAKLNTPNKLPPKRLQKLMEQAATTEVALNLEQLEEKQNKAELRRKEYLQQKLDNIQKNISQQARNKEDSAGEEQILSKSKTENEEHAESFLDMESKIKYENEIKSKALDDDSKQELLTSTLN